MSLLLVGSFVPFTAGIAAVPSASAHNAPLSGAQSLSRLQAELPRGFKPLYLSTLASLYGAHRMQPMWDDHKALQEFQQQLAELALSGVQPQFIQWVKWLTDPSVTGMSRDIVLSDAMLGYLQYVSGVEANGSTWLYSATPYKMSPPPASAINQWQSALRKGTSEHFISSLAPQHPQYVKMHAALKTLLADRSVWPKMVSTTSIKPGQSSDDMPALREILARTGGMIDVAPDSATANEAVDKNTTSQADDFAVDETSDKNHAVPVGNSSATSVKDVLPAPEVVSLAVSTGTTVVGSHNQYTPQLVDAVKRFQKWQGLEDDGVIGARTRDWLNASPRVRATLLALNIQRLRILPGDVSNGIMVNIPNYSLKYYSNGAEVLSSRVIVGRPSRKTPLMSSALNTVVVNPPWNVPTSLVRQDIVPKAIRDASYLQKHGFTMYSGWGNDAEVVEPSSVNWSMVSPASFPYRLRQNPGAMNSLGRYKFNMPSSDAIYLHDTPNHNLFQRNVRALSSGCVRVNKASELANMLLQNSGWNSSRIATTLKEGNTTFVPIRQRIPVKLFYLTAWVADDGKPQFRTDIYNYDSQVRSGAQILSQAETLLQ